MAQIRLLKGQLHISTRNIVIELLYDYIPRDYSSKQAAGSLGKQENGSFTELASANWPLASSAFSERYCFDSSEVCGAM